jgi:hypothetical protein
VLEVLGAGGDEEVGNSGGVCVLGGMELMVM